MKLHTILGAGGTVGNQLLRVLQQNNERVRLVSRKAQPSANAEAVAADVTNFEQTLNAVKSSDVVYLVVGHGKADGVMTEETPFNPISKKGEVRATIATQLLNEMKARNIQALIARSADFYGPVGFSISAANMLVFGNLRKGKKAQWLVNAKTAHSLTYVPLLKHYTCLPIEKMYLDKPDICLLRITL